MTTILSLVLIALAAESPARFEAAADGTVRDAKTALIWAQKDNGADIDLAGATSYCDGLSLAGKDDWRLATVDELAALYDESIASPPTYLYRGKPYPLRMDPAFELSAPGVWSSTMRYQGRGVAWSFFFSSGRRLSTAATATNYQRALCVRGGA
jgi:hypothetical protein